MSCGVCDGTGCPYCGCYVRQSKSAPQEMEALRQQVATLTRERNIAVFRSKGTLANNLCPDCRDKQAGKPCLACVLQILEAQVAALTKELSECRLELCALFAQMEEALATCQNAIKWRGDTPVDDMWFDRIKVTQAIAAIKKFKEQT